MSARKKRTGIECVSELVSGHVTYEGEPYRPETLFWMGADGAVLVSIGGPA